MARRPTNPQTPVAVTMGDPAGIGPDIILDAWEARESKALCPFAVIGCPAALEARARSIGCAVRITEIDSPDRAQGHFHESLPVYPLSLAEEVVPGAPSRANAAGVIEAIEIAVSWTMSGKAGGVVTAPINKQNLQSVGFPHPGHTEFLAQLCKQPGEAAARPVMMLAADNLRVVPTTIHIPLAEVPRSLSQELIFETVSITANALKKQFGISEPSLAVTGLNPHAGEGGTLGSEEAEIIEPALQALRRDGLDVTGPLAADGAFQKRNRDQFDAFIAMYHDQALITIKALAFDEGVNVTLGLPIIRTSPDHGTAYPLAASGKANASSMIEALRLAATLAARNDTQTLEKA